MGRNHRRAGMRHRHRRGIEHDGVFNIELFHQLHHGRSERLPAHVWLRARQQ